MYRWPVRLLEGLEGESRDAASFVLEVSPRAAPFTLASLSYLGHPVHLALIDAFLAGSVLMPRGLSLGEDSQAIVAALTGPLVLLYQLAGEEPARATLADVLLLPPARGGPVWARFLFLASPERHLWLTCTSEHAAEPEPGWHRVVTALPVSSGRRAFGASAVDNRPLRLLARSVGPPHAATETDGAPLRAALRRLTWGQVGGDPRVVEQAIDSLRRAAEPTMSPVSENLLLYSLLQDAIAMAAAYRGVLARAVEPDRLDPALQTHLADDRVLASTVTRGGRTIDVTSSVDETGGATLTLLPRELTARDQVVADMGDAAWATLESLIGHSLAERRTEAITLRLVGPGRTAELLIGWSLVLPRNRRVFAAWLGSDGRVVIRLSGGHDTPIASPG